MIAQAAVPEWILFLLIAGVVGVWAILVGAFFLSRVTSREPPSSERGSPTDESRTEP